MNLGIIDGIYGELREENIKPVISTFGTKSLQKPEDIKTSVQDLAPDVIQLAKLLTEQMKK
jgi:hypothetical protein